MPARAQERPSRRRSIRDVPRPGTRFYDADKGVWRYRPRGGGKIVDLHSPEGEAVRRRETGGATPSERARSTLRRSGMVVDRGAARTAAGGYRVGRAIVGEYEPGFRSAGELLVWAFASIIGLALLEAALQGRGPVAVEKILQLGGGTIQKLFSANDPLFARSYAPASSSTTSTSSGGASSAVMATRQRAGGFLPKKALYKAGRADQGRDFQTDPGGAIIAPGAGSVVDVKSDPHGFGPSYPVVRFTSGPYKGQTLYIGHTLSALKKGSHFVAGQVLSHTGKTPVGNASVAGWAEIGYAAGGTPGKFGQRPPF